MTDLERLLTEALRESGESYEPSDQATARRRFLERARRRRWYGFAQVAALAGVGLAAFLFFTYNSGTEEKVEPTPEVASAPEIVATIKIGGEPISIDSATGSEVWVSGGDRLVAIDPSTNEETRSLQLEDGPGDEVAVGDGHIWVSQTDGSISGIDPSTGDSLDEFGISHPEGSPVYFDLATDGDSLWAVDGLSDRVYRLGGPGSSQEIVIPGYIFSDVTVSTRGDVWALDQEQGAIVHVDPSTQEAIGRPIEVPAGENADLIAGFQFVYLSPGNGTLYKISPPGTTDMIEADLGDSYMDLTVHEKSVWALVDVEDEPKLLFEINPATMEVIGEPLEIPGDANDVVAEAGSVWVADGRGEVLRIEPSRDTDDVPPPAEDDDQSDVEPSPAPVDPDEIVFVYSANGDIFAETESGEVVRLTDRPEIEQHPSFAPDGNSIVFERDVDRGPDGSGGPDVVKLDPATREEDVIGMGSWPALAPDGRLATVGEIGRDDSDIAAIHISGEPSDPITTEVNGVGTEELPDISNLSWSPDGERLVWQAAGEGTVIKEAVVDGIEITFENTLVPTEDTSLNESSDFQEGSNLVSPQASSDGVLVLRLCCRETVGDPFEDMHIGRVRQDIEGISYQDLGTALGSGVPPGYEAEFAPAGHLALDADEDGHQWAVDSEYASWFLFEVRSIWLGHEDNTYQHVSGDGSPDPAPGHEGETDFAGLAVHPSLLD